MAPRASTRVSIRWPPAPASEPTDTLVLSVGGYYVDLRVRKSDGEIDWALAGERIVDPQHSAKVKFTHIIDSHHNPSSSEPEPAPDVGDFIKLPNGDDLETGEMPNPDAGGQVMPYEEIWRELKWPTGNSCWFLESVDSHDAEKGTATTTRRTKTFHAKVGNYYLALRQVINGEDVTFVALRQDYHIDDEEGKGWKTIYEIGKQQQQLQLDRLTGIDERLGTEATGWRVGEKVVVGNESYIVRASE
ncbi:hypothetical protein A1O1_01652 [Capronia coronata CBS 617.96]|uniref:Protein HRI1 n=1 Tax=Capronia coronata CBS 617.96 TaxID=1182541 RepID=W9YVG2_9EURO|nr:uncharacterized protein A1O1_01652 [Capronia coronata CBS 617.96]EXJ93261.1 hypothetical protein A1O1_01652 [Capronia coronata CBS 617.96]